MADRPYQWGGTDDDVVLMKDGKKLSKDGMDLSGVIYIDKRAAMLDNIEWVEKTVSRLKAELGGLGLEELHRHDDEFTDLAWKIGDARESLDDAWHALLSCESILRRELGMD